MKPYLVFVFENGDDCVATEDDEFVIHFTTLARSSTLSKVVLRGEKSPVSSENIWADLLHPMVPQKEE